MIQKIENKQSKQIKEQRISKTHSYLCLQSPQTIQILNYLTVQSSKLNNQYNDKKTIKFISDSQKQGSSKKQKLFNFDKLYDKFNKFKYNFKQEINSINTKLINGNSQSILIYGTQQLAKDKIIIGQSQNPGLLLSLISDLFDLCHKQQLEDKITIKISGVTYKGGFFRDIYDANQQTILIPDICQKSYFIGVAQIIIRNIKTAIKCINLMEKKIFQERNNHSEPTQSIIITIKLEIQSKNNNKIPTAYTISKLNLIKLADTSINNTLQGINKSNKWFVDLFNYLQSQTLYKQSTKTYQDGFVNYIRMIALNNVSDIYNFISLTNKMTSNQCLSALIFNNYLQTYTTKYDKCYIDFEQLQSMKNKLQGSIINRIKMQELEQVEKCQKFSNIYKKQCQSSSLLMQIIQKYSQIMKQFNYFQYQFSLVLSHACNLLNKYIFTEQIEDYFYSKKINVAISKQLKQAKTKLIKTKLNITQIKNRILKNCEESNQNKQNKANRSLNIQSTNNNSIIIFQQILGNKNKQKIQYEKLFQIYQTLSYHYSYAQNQQLLNLLKIIQLRKINDQTTKNAISQINNRNIIQEGLLFNQKINNVINNKNQQLQLVNKKKLFQKQQQKADYKNNENKKISWNQFSSFYSTRSKINNQNNDFNIKKCVLNKQYQSQLDRMFKNPNVGVKKSNIKI